MAGDGGRVPDVSEQRSECSCDDGDDRMTVLYCPIHGQSEGGFMRRTEEALRVAREVSVRSDPASVLAALLAESPEATVSAIEALLTSDEATRTAVEDWRTYGNAMPRPDLVRSALSAACRSLLSKAPKEDGDA